MLVGINYPWIDYGWDFGDPPTAWVGIDQLPGWRAAKRKRIEDDFRLFAALGIFAVRWFLLGDGSNYGTGEAAPRKGPKGWTFDPLPAGHRFYTRLCEDFEFVLQCCAQNNLMLFPSLIDFRWCFQGTPAAGNPDVISCGRSDILRHPRNGELFFNRVLEPLLASSMLHRDAVYAWELINEPEWAVRKFSIFGKKDESRTVTPREMKNFIVEGVRRINNQRLPDGSRAFQSSVGFAHWETLSRWDSQKLGVTQHQFHYYAQENRPLPLHAHSGIQPCIVGEFATAAGREWPDLRILSKDQTTANRLRCVEDKGYPACFLWSARAQDPATEWTERGQQEVIAYTGSKPSAESSA